jgi:chorismate dehydratase
VRISAVEYLNSAPLYWGLKAGRHPEGWEVAFHKPSECARRLLAGEADIGLIPSVEFAREPALRLAAPLCVAARREVTSVLLFCGGPLDSVRAVCLDPSSRTSQALTRVLFERGSDREIRFEERKADPMTLKPFEAALVIGDDALALSDSVPPSRRVDLAQWWHRETGLPFVFAVWAGRQEACTREAREVLSASFLHGRDSTDEIVRAFSERLGLPEATLKRYLTENLHFTLGDEERRAMARFFREVFHKEFPHERLRLPAPAA